MPAMRPSVVMRGIYAQIFHIQASGTKASQWTLNHSLIRIRSHTEFDYETS